MKSNYKRLGEYIKEINIRNTSLSVTKLIGVSMEKKFIQSVANVVGTDMSVYKILKRGQFACKLMSVGRDGKLPVDLYKENEDAIVSSAYYVFESIDNDILVPEYLLMWLCRPENDRYIGYISGGDVRGGISWEAFCETPIKIPSITKQSEIVDEYYTILNRIKLNERQWFVDFEFPDENGNPYKSSGGEMEYNEELKQEVPCGWEVKPFTKVVKLGGGGTPSTDNIEYWDGDVPFYTPGDIAQSYYSISTNKKITALGLKKCSSKLYPKNTTFITARGATVGGIAMGGIPMAMNQTCYAINGYDGSDYFANQLSLTIISKLKKEAIGATFEALVTKNFEELSVIEPNKKIVQFMT